MTRHPSWWPSGLPRGLARSPRDRGARGPKMRAAAAVEATYRLRGCRAPTDSGSHWGFNFTRRSPDVSRRRGAWDASWACPSQVGNSSAPRQREGKSASQGRGRGGRGGRAGDGVACWRISVAACGVRPASDWDAGGLIGAAGDWLLERRVQRPRPRVFFFQSASRRGVAQAATARLRQSAKWLRLIEEERARARPSMAWLRRARRQRLPLALRVGRSRQPQLCRRSSGLGAAWRGQAQGVVEGRWLSKAPAMLQARARRHRRRERASRATA